MLPTFCQLLEMSLPRFGQFSPKKVVYTLEIALMERLTDRNVQAPSEGVQRAM